MGNRWAELKRKADKVDPVFAVLAQFGTTVHPLTGGTPGPRHNQIAEPDRAVNNSTYWEADFSQAHFNKMYNGPGESLADFYMKQSGGKYSTNAAVSDWVQLDYNEARYGHNFERARLTTTAARTGRSFGTPRTPGTPRRSRQARPRRKSPPT